MGARLKLVGYKVLEIRAHGAADYLIGSSRVLV